jgi:hypothetical protein
MELTILSRKRRRSLPSSRRLKKPKGGPEETQGEQ